MADKDKKNTEAGAVELTEGEATAVSGGAKKLTGDALTGSKGKLDESLADPKKKNIVQCYPSVEYDHVPS